jgi:hypothetical protein
VSVEWNIYCDESCHLERDGRNIMVMGAISCPRTKTREISVRLREMKEKHGIPGKLELKWTKVSPAKLRLYEDVIDFFFDNDDLSFRGVVIDKAKLNHPEHDSTHEAFYYKMYFLVLECLLDPEDSYFIYLDIKDSRSAAKTQKLGDVLANSNYDYQRRIVRHIQNVRSDEIEQLQLCDLLIGALRYANEEAGPQLCSPAKQSLVQRIRRRSGYSLTRTTLLRERKMNILMFRSGLGGDV